jgi:hypothetical protein
MAVPLLLISTSNLRADGEDYAERHLAAVQSSCIDTHESSTPIFYVKQAG